MMGLDSLDTLMKIINFLEVPIMEIDHGLCSYVRLKGSCTKCRDYCPTEAITLGRKISIDSKKCIMCGGCQTVCSNGVFTLLEGSDETLLSTIDEIASTSDSIAFQCNGFNNFVRVKFKKPPKGYSKLTVPCLGRINEIILLRCNELGFRDILFSECHHRCPHKQARTALDEAKLLTENLLNAIKISSVRARKGPFRLNEQMNGHTSQNRRDFVYEAGRKAITIALDLDIKKKKANRHDKLLPQRRHILVSYTKKYGCTEYLVEARSMPFGEVEILDACNGCGVCSHICPTGALKMDEEGATADIIFDFPGCIGCGLCVTICDAKAVQLKNEVNLGNLSSEPRILHSLPQIECAKCNMRFVPASDSQFCPQCEKRETLRQTMIEMRGRS